MNRRIAHLLPHRRSLLPLCLAALLGLTLAAPALPAVPIAPSPTTSLSDPSANDWPVTSLVDGQILVISTLVIPEPAAFWSAAMALAVGGCAWARARRRKVRSRQSGGASEGEP